MWKGELQLMPLVLTRRPDQSVQMDLQPILETMIRIAINRSAQGMSLSEILAEIPPQEIVIKLGKISRHKAKLIVSAPDAVPIIRSEIMEEAT